MRSDTLQQRERVAHAIGSVGLQPNMVRSTSRQSMSTSILHARHSDFPTVSDGGLSKGYIEMISYRIDKAQIPRIADQATSCLVSQHQLCQCTAVSSSHLQQRRHCPERVPQDWRQVAEGLSALA